jgi:hypothetical protein
VETDKTASLLGYWDERGQLVTANRFARDGNKPGPPELEAETKDSLNLEKPNKFRNFGN